MKQNYQARCFLNWQPGSGGLCFLTLLYEAQMATEQKAQERKHYSKHNLGCGPAPLLHLTPRPCLRLPFLVLWFPTHLSWAAALSWGDTNVQIAVLPGSGPSLPVSGVGQPQGNAVWQELSGIIRLHAERWFCGCQDITNIDVLSGSWSNTHILSWVVLSAGRAPLLSISDPWYICRLFEVWTWHFYLESFVWCNNMVRIFFFLHFCIALELWENVSPKMAAGATQSKWKS